MWMCRSPGTPTSRYPDSHIEELEQRLVGAHGPTSDDQSRTLDAEVLDSPEAARRFLAEVDRVRREQTA